MTEKLNARRAADEPSQDRPELLRPLARVLLIQARRQLAREAREKQQNREKVA
jgi:hypothetical protein